MLIIIATSIVIQPILLSGCNPNIHGVRPQVEPLAVGVPFPGPNGQKICEDPLKGVVGDVAARQPADKAADLVRFSAERRRYLCTSRWTYRTEACGPVHHTDYGDLPQYPCNRPGGERAIHHNLQCACPNPLRPKLVYNVAGGTGHRTHGNNRHLRVLQHIGTDSLQPSAKPPLKFRKNLLRNRCRVPESHHLLIPHLAVIIRGREIIDKYGVLGIEIHILSSVLPHKPKRSAVFGDIHLLHGMGEKEPVLANHRRRQHIRMFTDPDSG